MLLQAVCFTMKCNGSILGSRNYFTDRSSSCERNAFVDEYLSISESCIDEMRERISIAGEVRTVCQLKLAVGTLDQDIEKVSAVLDIMTSNQSVQADAPPSGSGLGLTLNDGHLGLPEALTGLCLV